MNIEHDNSGYDQETVLPQEVVVEGQVGESLERKPTRFRGRLYGPLLSLVLASGLALSGEGKNTNDSEPPVLLQQGGPNLINNSSFETPDPLDSTEPQYWDKVINTPGVLPLYQDGIFHGVGSKSVGAKHYGTSSCQGGTNGWRLEQSFLVNPSQTYTERFWASYDLNDQNSEAVVVRPVVVVIWKDSQGQPNGSDYYNPPHGVGENVWQEFTRIFGPGGVEIPVGTASASLIVGMESITSNDPCVDTVYAVESLDEISFTGPPPSVGGIAELPQLPELNLKQESGSSREISTEVAIATGLAAATVFAAAGVESIRRRRNKRHG
mgnify:CR=1 FL=1